MVLFSILTFSLLIFADPPSAYKIVDQEIKQRCAREDIEDFDDCVQRLGKENYQRQTQANSISVQDPICRPREAVVFCKNSQKESVIANNPSSTDNEIGEAIRDCRMKCNPGSSLMLREFFGGCGTQGTDEKKELASLRDKCGIAIGEKAVAPKESENKNEDSWSGWVQSKYESAKSAASSGFQWAETKMKMIGATNRSLDTFDDQDNLNDTFPGEVTDTSDLSSSPIPPRHSRSAAEASGSYTDTDSSRTGKISPQKYSPSVSNGEWTASPTEPLSQQAGVSGAFLQNSLRAPIQAGNSAPSMSSGAANGTFNEEPAPSSFTLGKWEPSGTQVKYAGSGITALRVEKLPPVARAVLPSDVARVSPVSGNRSGFYAPPAGGGAPVRGMVGAPSKDISVASYKTGNSEGYYGGQPTNYAGGGYYTVPVDPGCRSSGTKRCAMRRVAIDDTAKINCNGNPECLLKLTGKIKWRKFKIKDNFPERGVASDFSLSKNRLPKGVWRGYGDVLNHINTLDVDYLRLDHEGFLIVDDNN